MSQTLKMHNSVYGLWNWDEKYDTIEFVLTAVVVGFERRTYTVNEEDGQVELCVNITVPRQQDIGTFTFNLTVETQNGTAGIIETVQILL